MIIKNKTSKILNELRRITPMSLYMSQVHNCMDTIRATAAGKSYMPNQFGGLPGQRAVLQDVAVLQILTFDVE